MKTVRAIALLALICCPLLPFAAEPVTVALRDHGRALLNPGMGWTMHFYSNLTEHYGSKLEPSDTLEWFEGCSVVYLRLPWAFLEPSEGDFRWSLVDTPAQRWISRGKKVAFRFTTSENWLEYATPHWVEQAGAKMVRYTFPGGPAPDGAAADPVFDDPVYLAELRNFLRAAGERYNGETLNFRRLPVGPAGRTPLTKHVSRLTLDARAPTVKPGRYTLSVSVGSRDGNPEIALPYDGGDSRNRIPVGSVEILKEPR